MSEGASTDALYPLPSKCLTQSSFFIFPSAATAAFSQKSSSWVAIQYANLTYNLATDSLVVRMCPK